MPAGVPVVLLADRGFADGKLMKYLKENLGWPFRIRIKRSFQFQLEGQWRKVSSVKLLFGQVYCPKHASAKLRTFSARL